MKMPDDVKSELFNVLTSLPKEVDGLKRAIVDGSFDGSTYDTSNGTRGACLVGTVCKMQMRRINRVFRADNGRDYTAKVTTPTGTFIVDADSALEQWVFFIYPENRGNAEADGRRAALLAAIAEWEVTHKARVLRRWYRATKRFVKVASV